MLRKKKKKSEVNRIKVMQGWKEDGQKEKIKAS